MMETSKRSLAKAVCWRVIATLLTTAIALAITGEIKLAASIGFADTVVKLFVYYLHERMWNAVHFGRKQFTQR